jgi:hypothetical protein
LSFLLTSNQGNRREETNHDHKHLRAVKRALFLALSLSNFDARYTPILVLGARIQGVRRWYFVVSESWGLGVAAPPAFNYQRLQ